MVTTPAIDRTQTGVRIATPLLKVLKALAEYKDMSLGDLLEGIVLHAFEGKCAFSDDTLATIAKLSEIGVQTDESACETPAKSNGRIVRRSYPTSVSTPSLRSVVRNAG